MLIYLALDRLGAPPRLVFLFLFTYRYLHVLTGEWQRLLTAAKLRGFIPRTNMHTYRTLGFLSRELSPAARATGESA